jgi:hypothetical protein
MYDNHPIKFLFMGINAVSCLITTPIFYWLIVLEKQSHYRTLVNQIMATVMSCFVVFNIIITPLTFFIYIISPTNSEFICKAYTFTFNIITLHPILLMDAWLIIKYLFVFHLKNPTAVQDDFWSMLINLWIFIFWAISLIVYHILPGKDYAKITTCVGKISVKYFDEKVKKNWTTFVVILISIILNILFWGFRILFKHCCRNNYQSYEQFKSMWTNMSKRDKLNYISIWITMLLFAGSTAFMYTMSEMPPSKLDTYPYFIFVYFQDHVMSYLVIVLSLTVYIISNNNVKKELWKEIGLRLHIFGV